MYINTHLQAREAGRLLPCSPAEEGGKTPGTRGDGGRRGGGGVGDCAAEEYRSDDKTGGWVSG